MRQWRAVVLSMLMGFALVAVACSGPRSSRGGRAAHDGTRAGAHDGASDAVPTGDAARPPMSAAVVADAGERCRARDLGVAFGALPAGPLDAITDVPGVRVGHGTVREGTACSGVTVVLPHGGNPFLERVPAAVFVANGFGKPFGFVQVQELGELEAPIALTGTLNVPRVADGLLDWILALPGCADVRSVNPVVLETNDGRLNDLRSRPVHSGHVAAALAAAATAGAGADGAMLPGVDVGAVGAGAGTVCFGYKGGIGTASRRVGEFTVGVLAQTNFGGALTIAGVPVGERLRALERGEGTGASQGGAAGEQGAGAVRDRREDARDGRGSCAIVVATDAPLDARNLERLAARAFAGMARTGASFSNGSGDYAIAFSTAPGLRRGPDDRRVGGPVLGNAAMSPLFQATADATEEAIVDSICAAATTTANGITVPALPLDAVRAILGGGSGAQRSAAGRDSSR